MNEIKMIMLGHLAYDITNVIITPLKSTFYKLKEKLKEKLKVEETYNNVFFENCVFRIGDKEKKGLLVLSPQGIASKDIIELFDNIDILFFGLAGSISDKYEIGTFVEARVAVGENNKEIKLAIIGEMETVKCGYSPCLLGSLAKKHCNLAKVMQCDVVDMETLFCAETAIEKNNRFTSLLLISDIPEKINFWELSDQDQKKLRDARIIAVDKIINYIDNLAGKE